jgi:hypothetical protein
VTAHGTRTQDDQGHRRTDMPTVGRFVHAPSQPANDNPMPRAVLVQRMIGALATLAVCGGLVLLVLLLE